jgi:hypothetical protein
VLIEWTTPVQNSQNRHGTKFSLTGLSAGIDYEREILLILTIMEGTSIWVTKLKVRICLRFVGDDCGVGWSGILKT